MFERMARYTLYIHVTNHMCLFSSFSEYVYQQKSIATKRVFLSSILPDAIPKWIGTSIHNERTPANKTVLQKSSMCIWFKYTAMYNLQTHGRTFKYIHTEHMQRDAQLNVCEMSYSMKMMWYLSIFFLFTNELTHTHARGKNTFDVARKHKL